MTSELKEFKQKVFVYFNLHKKVFSLRAANGINKGRVIGHTNQVLLENVAFKVSESGRQRVLLERRKNVHAGVQGTLVSLDLISIPEGARIASYNPYKHNRFFYKDTGEDLIEAKQVYLTDKLVYIIE